MEESNMLRYKIPGKHGIDDLMSPYAFYFNDGGGGSYSNDVAVYRDGEGWWGYLFGNDIDPHDQEAINAESLQREQVNAAYIEQLHAEGRFGEPYETTINMQHNPLFDDNRTIQDSLATSSYRMIFLDTDKEVTGSIPAKLPTA